MTAHKHKHMIKAKADNRESVLFFKADGGIWRKIDSQDVFPTSQSDFVEYFLSHPKHADVCLHWLNGGDAEIVLVDSAGQLLNKQEYGDWHVDSVFSDEVFNLRIKPHKERRWVVVKNGALISNRLFVSEHEAEVVCGCGGHDAQFIEIEVEV